MEQKEEEEEDKEEGKKEQKDEEDETKKEKNRGKEKGGVSRALGGREEGLVSISADTVSGISARLVRAASDERRNLQKSAADRDKSGRPMFAN